MAENIYRRPEVALNYLEFRSKSFHPRQLGIISFLAACLQPEHGREHRALDVGSGSGSLTLPLLEELNSVGGPWVVNALDDSPEMIKLLNERVHHYAVSTCSMRIERENFNDPAFVEKYRPATFDTILALFVQAYFDDWRRLLKCFDNWLIPGGCLVQAEEGGFARLIDGRAGGQAAGQQVDPAVVAFWCKYHGLRSALGVRPLPLRMTDMEELFAWLDSFCIRTQREFCWPVVCTPRDFLQWIAIGAFSPLSLGLTEKNRVSLRKDMTRWLQTEGIPLDVPYQLPWAMRFVVHKKASDTDV
jgi:SAM-dependent methyltransferase